MKSVDKNLGRRIIAYAFLIMASLVLRTAVAGTTVATFNAPLTNNLGGTGVDASAVTDGQLLVGATSGHAFALAAITGTANQVTVTNGANTITLATPQNIATGSDVTFNTLVSKRTITAKTADFTVTTATTGTVVFTNTGAGGAVVFTLPTAAAGLTYTFYVDAAQTLEVLAGASTTIRVGGNVSGAAGNITNAVLGGSVTLVAISTTQWVAVCATGTWTTT